MEIVVIGLGSMGKRRIRLLHEMYVGAQIFGVDAKEDRRAECGKLFSIRTYKSVNDCLQEHTPETAFVCTPPLSHAGIIRECLSQDMNVFSEINLVPDGYAENMELAKQRNRVLFLSSTPLYREEIGYISHRVKETDGVANYSFHVGQYLPDWHPWDVLQDFFVSRKETNGCRELFAIELPWILQTFGKVKRIKVMRHKATSLPIQYDDSYFVMIEHETGHHGALMVDVVSREPVRHLEVFGEKLFLAWDGTPGSLREKDLERRVMEAVDVYLDTQLRHENEYSQNIIENAYAAEIKNFMATVAGTEEPRYSFAADEEVLRLIDQIENSSRGKDND